MCLCLYVVGKAFAVATVILFGGATAIFGMTASKLDVHNVITFPFFFFFFHNLGNLDQPTY